MELNDELCLCFHVTKRKVVNYLKVNRVRRASQLSECYGAGTGCGWCRPFLIRLFEAQQAQKEDDLPTSDQYAQNRADYVRSGQGTPPPGASPLPDEK
jgi:bacterioferritin-associated ferredoxin